MCVCGYVELQGGKPGAEPIRAHHCWSGEPNKVEAYTEGDDHLETEGAIARRRALLWHTSNVGRHFDAIEAVARATPLVTPTNCGDSNTTGLQGEAQSVPRRDDFEFRVHESQRALRGLPRPETQKRI